MTPVLNALSWNEGQGTMLANVSGELEPNYDPQLLIDQIDRPVLWTKILKTAWDSGVREFIEIGPGKVLSGLVKRQGLGNVSCLYTGPGLMASLTQLQ